MADRTTRPHAPLAACRIRRYVVALAVLAWLAGGPAAAQTGPAQVDRVIDGDTIRVRLDVTRYTVRFTGVDTSETTHPTRYCQLEQSCSVQPPSCCSRELLSRKHIGLRVKAFASNLTVRS